MDLMQLKMPPEHAQLLADAVDFYIEDGKDPARNDKLQEISTWLRYRISRWNKSHPDRPAA